MRRRLLGRPNEWRPCTQTSSQRYLEFVELRLVDWLLERRRRAERALTTVVATCLLAVGVNADGHRKILGLQVTSAEDGAGWLGFFRDLTARGLTGVKLVTAAAHNGLVSWCRS